MGLDPCGGACGSANQPCSSNQPQLIRINDLWLYVNQAFKKRNPLLIAAIKAQMGL
jgi:hypothetical protein